MSAAPFDKAKNNKYPDCPPRMDDARHFTDYRSHNYVNSVIAMTNNIDSSYEYRKYLIKNAKEIMKMNNEYAKKTNCFKQCDFKPIPHQYECLVDMNVSRCMLKDPNGIGNSYRAANS